VRLPDSGEVDFSGEIGAARLCRAAGRRGAGARVEPWRGGAVGLQCREDSSCQKWKGRRSSGGSSIARRGAACGGHT
jgi:hypothetical protein